MATGIFAQIPEKMSYQSVIRDERGALVSNQNVGIRITILRGSENGEAVFIERHRAVTNANGLATLEIGGGIFVMGSLSSIDWASGSFFIKTETDPRGGSNYSIAGVSQLLSVPYAFLAKKAESTFSGNYYDLIGSPVNVSQFYNDAGYITWDDLTGGGGNGAGPRGIPSQTWSVFGNSKTDPTKDMLGTSDNADLVIVTNNIERLRIQANGDIQLHNSLEIGEDLTVKQNVYLNTVGGATTNNGNLTVANGSATHLTGTLTVDGATDLNSTLDVDGATTLNSTLDVDGATTLNSTLDVDGATTLNSTVDVDGATTLNSTLDVDGATTINNTMQVSTNTTGYVATIINTNNGNGDGMLMKLGKTHPRWTGSAYVIVSSPGVQILDTAINQLSDWIFGNDQFSFDDVLNFIPTAWIAGTICNLTNDITSEINTALGLPLSIGPYSVPHITVVPEIDLEPIATIGPYGFGPIQVIPSVVVVPSIPQINCGGLPSFTFPVISLDNVGNSLTDENEYIRFADKDDRHLGAIRAQGIEDWYTSYLNASKLVEFACDLISIDPLDIALSAVSIVTQVTYSYSNIGIEYYSGNGDYAEWLERIDPKEEISGGDIVAVKGGKITKDLNGAQQIMAVSTRPIVLGNAPDEGQGYRGNNIAFMGQIPVKVLGPVQSGDYIVAKADVPGYGVAIHPGSMTVADYKLAVGRSWDTNLKNGPKMVNTVVGVHNNDFLNIISDLQAKSKETDVRLSALEATLSMSSDARTSKKSRKQ